MPKQQTESLYKQQKKSKPEIEDTIPDYLRGEKKELALGFVMYLRANKMKLTWFSKNSWRINHKGKCICNIRLAAGRAGERYEQSDGAHTWLVSLHFHNLSEHEKLIANEGLQGIFRENVIHCVHDSQSGFPPNHCNPNKNCARGRNMVIGGKEFTGVCQCCHNSLWVCDPGKTSLENIKRLLYIEQNSRTKSIKLK